MKIYYQNRSAKLKRSLEGRSCRMCPFNNMNFLCPWGTSTIIDCRGKGWWIDGESSDIFKV